MCVVVGYNMTGNSIPLLRSDPRFLAIGRFGGVTDCMYLACLVDSIDRVSLIPINRREKGDSSVAILDGFSFSLPSRVTYLNSINSPLRDYLVIGTYAMHSLAFFFHLGRLS